MKQEIRILLSPGEFAKVFDITISEVFRRIDNNRLDYQQTDEGIKIQVVYQWDSPD